jgi:hypothetical protein
MKASRKPTAKATARPRKDAASKHLTSTSLVTVLDAMREKELFARWFKDPRTWVFWTVFLASLFGLPIDAKGLEIFEQCTGRKTPLPGGYNEAWLCVGRRGGKSIVLALCAVFLGVFRDWSDRLVPGERGTVLVIAQDRKAARVIYRYITAMITEVPLIAGLVDGEPTQDRIDLVNGVSIEISTANFKTVRGYTLVAALCDEIAFWQGDDSSSPDTEILAALRPAMTTMAPDAMLLCASSPHARRGALWDAYRKFYGKEDAQVLVWQAATKTMNPGVSQRVLDEALERDPANFVAEYEAQFRTDVENFLAREVVEAAVVEGRFELPPVKGTRYLAFVDPSGGSADSMTLAIAHLEGNRVILDLIRERRPPFSPDNVSQEFAECIRAYGLATVRGDFYAGMWPTERFRAHGVEYRTSDRVKSDIYREMLPLINAGRVELLDSVKLVNQLCSLERKVARGGRDSIDHPPKAHDDIANAVAGALVLAAVAPKEMYFAPIGDMNADLMRPSYWSNPYDMSNGGGRPGGAPNPENERRRQKI